MIGTEVCDTHYPDAMIEIEVCKIEICDMYWTAHRMALLRNDISRAHLIVRGVTIIHETTEYHARDDIPTVQYAQPLCI